MDVRFSIGKAADRTGLSQHTIRAWERRYGILAPDRSGTNRRQYNEADLARLLLLKQAVDAGHAISNVANLPDDELSRLISQERPSSLNGVAAPYLDHCIRAMESLDAPALADSLRRGAATIGLRRLLEEIVLPLLELIGDRWQQGSLGIAHEHLASDVLRAFLHESRTALVSAPGSPRILVATPVGQRHEIGALIVALWSTLEGWHAVYLGTNLPASEIASAARQAGVKAVALSLVYPTDDPNIPQELEELRRRLGDTPILAGGRGTVPYAATLAEVDARVTITLDELSESLRVLAV